MIRYEKLFKGRFIDRPNRFIVHVEIDDETVTCHLPNPGRLWELLYVGTTVWVRKVLTPGRKTPYDVIGIERDGIPVLLDTQYNNDVAEALIREKRIPGWEDWDVLRREVAIEGSRFDLLLHRGDDLFFLEVKSCTLFSKNGAMFPDAVTERGRRHLLHLSSLRDKGIRAGILFLVQWNRARWFLPDYHTDPDFAETFETCADKLDWKAFTVEWNDDFSEPAPGRELMYPQAVLERENRDRGTYAVIYCLEEDRCEFVKAGKKHDFKAGYYVYIGAVEENLKARLSGLRRVRKKPVQITDYLRLFMTVSSVAAVRTSDTVEAEFASCVGNVSDGFVPAITGDDGKPCLFYFKENPVHYKPFIEALEDIRMNRLETLFDF